MSPNIEGTPEPTEFRLDFSTGGEWKLLTESQASQYTVGVRFDDGPSERGTPPRIAQISDAEFEDKGSLRAHSRTPERGWLRWIS